MWAYRVDEWGNPVPSYFRIRVGFGIVQCLVNPMNYIEMVYQTWEREECYGLFDYSEPNGSRSEAILIKSAGLLLRNENNHQLAFIENKPGRKDNALHAYRPLLRVDEIDGHFFIDNRLDSHSPDPLCVIIPSLPNPYRLKEMDTLRLGKATVQVLRVFWKQGRTRNHYEQVCAPRMAQRQSVFSSSFYSELEKASMIESNPACRLCYGKTIEEGNPFLAVCGCSGSAKYIHEECLVEWIRKRSGIEDGRAREGVYFAYAKAFTCEVCHVLYRLDRLIRKIFAAEGAALEEYVALQVNSEPPVIYVVDLSLRKEISIGRSLESTIVVNELSVSRRHCVIEAEVERQRVGVVDLKAKFGTVVEVERAEIEGEEYQKGRTKMQFRKCRKMSFFEKIGFCSPVENLRNERR